MDSLTFTPGRAFLSSDSNSPPWTVVFEDEGPAGYFYACDRSQETQEHSIMDAMLIYNGAALDDRDAGAAGVGAVVARTGCRRCCIWMERAQAMVDFACEDQSFCRSNFPNFLDEGGGSGWRKASHAWSDEALQAFEAALYAQ